MEKDNVNIFDEAKPGVFFKFEKVGDSIQGTYIGKIKGRSKFNEQIIYIIQDKSGNVWNVGFPINRGIIHERMNSILFGQIVGFRLDEMRPTDKGNDAKIIRIYADPKFIDKEWLKAQKELGVDPNGRTSGAVNPNTTIETEEDDPVIDDPSMFNGKPYEFKAPDSAEPSGGSIPKEQKRSNSALDAIRSLANTKGLTNESMSQAEVDNAIEAYTGLELTEENLTKIIIKLTGYTK